MHEKRVPHLLSRLKTFSQKFRQNIPEFSLQITHPTTRKL